MFSAYLQSVRKKRYNENRDEQLTLKNFLDYFAHLYQIRSDEAQMILTNFEIKANLEMKKDFTEVEE